MRPLVIHGHFYQPPRENPWTGTIPLDPATAPDHDWNARIHAECYAANAAARVCRDDGRITRIVNNFDAMSFNLGPTLVEWMRRAAPQTLARIVEADGRSRRRLGHGSAMAQVYNHVILPLASPADRRTQIRWGLASFRATFGREAEGMWLAECATNHDSLDDLIDHGVRFVVLAPQQAGRIREGDADWSPVAASPVDPGRAYRYGHREGRGELAVFFYDGEFASTVSFGEGLAGSREFEAAARAAATRTDGLVHLAVDGETFGHHRAWGDRVLAHALTEGLTAEFQPTNYAQVLAEAPATAEVELALGPAGEGTAWSCAHGVGRWTRDCGCRLDAEASSSQAWRGPLRAAFDSLRDAGAGLLERQLSPAIDDPWAARDDAVQLVMHRDPSTRAQFLERHGAAHLPPDDERRIMATLELHHQLQLMYSSCGWFFDDIAGREAVQCMRHAARALDLWAMLGEPPPLAPMLDILATAASNDPTQGSGADVFRRHALAARITSRQVTAVVGLRELAGRTTGLGREGAHRFEVSDAVSASSPSLRLAMGRITLEEVTSLDLADSLVAAAWPEGGPSRVYVMSWPGSAEAEALWARLLDAGEAGLEVLEATMAPQVSAELAPLLERLVDRAELPRVQEVFAARYGLVASSLDPQLREVGSALGFAMDDPA